MKDIVSSANKKNEATANMQHSHDFRNFWNYFFDFGNTGMENLEPKIDVVDNKDSVTIVAEIPGIKEDDIDIKISEDGYLTISGEKQNVSEKTSKNNYFKEISYGMFKRTIPLPWDLDYNTAQADYENGVLNLKIAKSQDEKHKFKKISINKKDKKNIENNTTN